MALEQLEAFLDGRPLGELGETEEIGPDHYPMLVGSELRDEHDLISAVLAAIGGSYHVKPQDLRAATHTMMHGDNAERTRRYRALLERLFGFEARISSHDFSLEDSFYFFEYGAASKTLATILRTGVDLQQIMLPTLRWLAAHHVLFYDEGLFDSLLTLVEDAHGTNLPPEVRRELLGIRCQMDLSDAPPHHESLLERVDALLGEGLWQVVLPGEHWTDQVIQDIESLAGDERSAWTELLEMLRTAKSSKPSGKWKKSLAACLEPIGERRFRQKLLEWFPLVDKGQARVILSSPFEPVDERLRIHEHNANILRGMLWACVGRADTELCRAIGLLAISAYRKARGLGPRAVKVGNAAVYALGEIGTMDALAQLAMLKIRVKFGTAQKGIEKALAATAERIGLPREDLEEMAVPAYGLTEVGVHREPLGQFTAELAVTGKKCELRWFKPDGKQQKSVPAAVKRDHGDDLKELKAAVKDIDKMLPAQAARIEQLYLQKKSWKLPVWRERYLDHPLVGTLARRLIWRFQQGDRSASGVWQDGEKQVGDEQVGDKQVGDKQVGDKQVGDKHGGEIVDSSGAAVDWIGGETTVELWHPLDEPSEQITAWRRWLETHQRRQPFKQAHRELYLLTDAERSTGVYSNRFAAHILKQHQFNALCLARNWKNTLRLAVDADFPPAHTNLPAWEVRAEFWVSSVGDQYGVDTNETGTYLYLSTDQVRFYRLEAAENRAHSGSGAFVTYGEEAEQNEPLPLERIPPLVFSEVMRDVDLFVGVASVGNDPNWADGGPDGRFLGYWQSYSFGELGATAVTRKAVLERLIPRLKIAGQCSFSDRFLVVRGSRRIYKIHLGSGNILMEPNDQYLCIVPQQTLSKPSDKVFLPFDGDGMLSIILSKALMLADDNKIKDPTILSQITD